ncbi:hypothetical protein [Roseibium sp.]|uniref:hypothetical protein n=1 Tax=Roseibium sp. TaxID=1936156 RepID=UPI003A984790
MSDSDPNTAADPFSDLEAKGPAPFAIGYIKSSGEALVFGGILFGVGFLVLGLFGDMRPLVFLSIVPLAVSFWHYPMIDTKDPQLGANDDGLFVERLGFIDWASIRHMELSRTAVRSIELVALEVDLTRPLAEAVHKKQMFPLWKSAMTRNWRASRQADGTDHLTIQLNTLAGKPEHILARLRAYRQV